MERYVGYNYEEIRETYEGICAKYEGICRNIYAENVEDMKKYVGNTKKCVENMKEYEEICRYIGFDTAHIGSGTWKNSELSLHIVSGTWNNSELSLHIVSGTWNNSDGFPSVWALGLEKILRSSFLLGYGTWEKF